MRGLTSLLRCTTSVTLPSTLCRASNVYQRPFRGAIARVRIVNMSTQSTQSKACCDTPAVVAKGYKPKGDYITSDGLKTYHTGSSSSKTGILVVYDIFGFYPQTLQGADILSTGGDSSSSGYQVFMPDLFQGDYADISWFPPDTEDKKTKLGSFFQTKAAPPTHLPRIPKIVDELSSKYGVTKWGVIGYCWGGKIVNLASMEGTKFEVAAAVHPAMVAADDAPGVKIPFLMLPSKDESQEDVGKWTEGLKVEHKVETFDTQVHGWMAARADLEDETVKKEYERGYKLVLEWFAKYL